MVRVETVGGLLHEPSQDFHDLRIDLTQNLAAWSLAAVDHPHHSAFLVAAAAPTDGVRADEPAGFCSEFGGLGRLALGQVPDRRIILRPRDRARRGVRRQAGEYFAHVLVPPQSALGFAGRQPVQQAGREPADSTRADHLEPR